MEELEEDSDESEPFPRRRSPESSGWSWRSSRWSRCRTKTSLWSRLPREQMQSTELLDVAPEHPAEETKAPTLLMTIYKSFIDVLDPVEESRARSGKPRGEGSKSGEEEIDGASENARAASPPGSTTGGRYRPC